MQPNLDELRDQARYAFERKDYATALGLYRTILAEQPDFADVRHAAGLCLTFLGRPEDALAEFERALSINPRYIEALVNRALVLHELGRYRDARVAFDLAREYDREIGGRMPAAATALIANAHAEVGDLYMQAGAPAEASHQYRAALELRPAFHDIRNKLAAALLALDWPEEAASELERVLGANPRFSAARVNLGLAYRRMGRMEDALREWQHVAASDPNNAQVRAYLSVNAPAPPAADA